MKRAITATLLAVACLLGSLPTLAAERALEKEMVIAASLEDAWVDVLANLKKRCDTGPQDWTEWLAQLKKWREDAAKAKAAKGS
jgi:hypothetical protein